MLLGQELKFKNKLCNLKLGTFFSALPGQRPGYNVCKPVALKGQKPYVLPGVLKLLPLQGDRFASVITQGDALG